METILSFLLKSTLSSGVLLGYYWLALRDKTFHDYNRFYLLATILISLITPFFHFTWYPIDSSVLPPFLGAFIQSSDQTQLSVLTWPSVLAMTGFAISLILLIILFVKIGWVYRIKRKYSSRKMNGFHLIETDLDQAPFTFFNNLFWRKNISLNDEHGKKIYKHELTHISGKHTYDKLFAQFVECLVWVNPFYRIIKKELCLVHEYIADSKSIVEGDGESFARTLLMAHSEVRHSAPSHLFFSSPIKRRLTMITTTGKIRYPYLRKLMVIPVFVLVLGIFSFSVTKAQCKEQPQEKTKLLKAAASCNAKKK